MTAGTTVFTHWKFWLLVLSSAVLPFGIYTALLVRRAISRRTVLFFGFVLVALAGLDVYLLQTLAISARLTTSAADNAVFLPEVYTALYLLPLMFGGIGVNIVSHVLLRHLNEAERAFEREHPGA